MPRKMTRKAILLEEYRDLGFTDEQVEWMAKRYTADQIQTAIDNVKTHDTIARMAKKVGLDRAY